MGGNERMKIFTKRNAKRVFIGWLLLNLILLIIYWPLVKQLVRFSPVILPSHYSTPANMGEAREQDISHLRKLLKYDRSFSESEQASFLQQLDVMSDTLSEMSDAEFYMVVRKAVAYAENGHTNVSYAPSYRHFNRSGIETFWFSDGLYIVRALSTHADLIGMRIVEIEGRNPEETYKTLGDYTGGAETWKRLRGHYFLRSPALMHAAGLAASPDLLNIKVVNAQGEQRPVSLQALPTVKDEPFFARPSLISLSADALPDEIEGWERTLNLEGDAVPLYLRDFQNNFKTEAFGSGVYVRATVLFNRGGMSIADRLAAVAANAPEGGYDFIAFDLRLSPGGDFGNVANFSQNVKDILSAEGKVYVITGPQTFSAAIVSAALFKRFAPDQTLIIGEPMGDHPQFWAERGMSFKLPNSEYYISYATGYHDWEKGCTDTHKYCFSRNAKYDGAEISLMPDVLIAPSYEDYASGRDIAMDWVLNENK